LIGRLADHVRSGARVSTCSRQTRRIVTGDWSSGSFRQYMTNSFITLSYTSAAKN